METLGISGLGGPEGIALRESITGGHHGLGSDRMARRGRAGGTRPSTLPGSMLRGLAARSLLYCHIELRGAVWHSQQHNSRVGVAERALLDAMEVMQGVVAQRVAQRGGERTC